MKLNICMLLPLHYQPDMWVYPQVGMCGYLSNFGHSLTWVVWAEESPQVQPFPFDGGQVYTTPYVRYFRGASLLPRVLNTILSSFRRARIVLKIFRKEKYDLIFVLGTALDGLISAYVRKRYKVPFVLVLSAPLEERWESWKIAPPMPLFLCYLVAKSNEFVTKRLLRQADLILPTSKWLKEHLVEQGIPESKIMPYPNGVDIDLLSREGGRNIRNQYQLGDSKIIIYMGAVAKIRYLTVLIQAFAKVKQERKNAKLLMVGSTGHAMSGSKISDEENLSRLATELGVRDDVIFTGQVPHSEVFDFIAAADIGVSPVPPLSFFKLSSPVKQLEYMAMSKPVVASEEIPEHRMVVEQSGGGILVPFTPEAFAEAIIELLDNPERAAEIGRRGREWLVKNRSYEVMARQLERRYLQLLGSYD